MFGFSFSFLSCCSKNKNSTVNNTPKDISIDDSRTSSDIQLLNMRKRISAKSRLSQGFASYYEKGISILSRTSDLSPTYDTYPKNEVIIIGKYYKIIAKIVQRKISESLEPGLGISRLGTLSGGSNLIDTSLSLIDGSSITEERLSENSILENFPKEKKREIFSLYKQGVKVEGWLERVPENVARHIAYRLKCDTIIDVLCEYGENAIQFAKFSNTVIAICPTMKKALSSLHNSQIYKMNQRIDFIAGDFTKMKNLIGDVIFLNPSFHKTNEDDEEGNKKNFCLLNSMKENIPKLIAKSLHISSKVALRLPGWTKIDELVDLFHLAMREYRKPTKRYSIEIEEILNTDDEVEHILVLFGDCSSVLSSFISLSKTNKIDLKEEYEAIYEHILNTESPSVRLRYNFQVIGAILDKIGVNKALLYINEVSDKKSLHQPLLKSFLNKLIKEGIFTQQSLDQFVEEELKRPSYSLANLDTFESRTSLDRRDSEFPSVSLLKENPSNTEIDDNKQKENPEIVLNNKNTLKVPQDKISGTQDLLWKGFSNFSYQSDSSGVPNLGKESKVGSELAVSSYSVPSNYLNDSETEETIDMQRNNRVDSHQSHGKVEQGNVDNDGKITTLRKKEKEEEKNIEIKENIDLNNS